MSSKENVSIDIKSIIIPGLTQQKIEDYANDNRLYKRGLDCYKQGIVSEVSKIEKSVQATVFGSNDQEYSVKISFDDRVINIFKCTCPYDGGVCKHLVAVMLYCLYDADKVLQSQPLNELLSKLDKSHLCTLIETIAKGDHHLYNKICMEIDVMRASHQLATRNKSDTKKIEPIDPTPYKKEIIYAFAQAGRDAWQMDYYSEDSWDGSGIIEKLTEIVAKTDAVCMHNEGAAALNLLEAITEICVNECNSLEDKYGYYDEGEGCVGEIFSILSHTWCQAILTSNLTPKERAYYSSRMESWQANYDINCNDFFKAILLALKEGWHDQVVQKALAGNLAPYGLEFEVDREIVAQARLKILFWQQRFAECVHFARYVGFTLELVEALLKQGLKDEAFVEAEKAIGYHDELLLIAKKFTEYDEPALAIKIAQKGLVVNGITLELPDWLCSFAESHQFIDIAQQAAVVCFKNRPTLERYNCSLRLTSADQINSVKEDLLDYLVKHKNNALSDDDVVNIFLHEKRYEHAMAIFDNKQDTYFIRDSAIKKVMHAVINDKPDWVIHYADKLALSIIEKGRASSYSEAIDWLSMARDAHKISGKTSEWVAYLNSIKTQHKTKRKLIALCNEAF